MEKNWRELISQPKYGLKVEKDIYVPVRDGVRIAIDIFRPDARGKFPALLAMSGYGKDEVELLLPPQPLNRSAVRTGVFAFRVTGASDIADNMHVASRHDIIIVASFDISVPDSASIEWLWR